MLPSLLKQKICVWGARSLWAAGKGTKGEGAALSAEWDVLRPQHRTGLRILPGYK